MGEVFTRRLREMDGKQRKVWARHSRQHLSPRSCAARLKCRKSNARRSKMHSTRPSPLKSPSVRNRAGPGQRDRAHHEWTEGGLEHRGVSRVTGEGVGELLKEKEKAEVQAKTPSALTLQIGKRAYELYEEQGARTVERLRTGRRRRARFGRRLLMPPKSSANLQPRPSRSRKPRPSSTRGRG